MKLAIMTWYHYRNYGTALQAVSLTTVLKELGHIPKVIQYKPIGYFRTIPDYRISKIVKRICAPRNKNVRKDSLIDSDRDKLFEEFLHKYVDYTDLCETKSDLERLNDEFDAFICGSDQIWSPLAFDPKYYLDFVHNPRKKIAYAPSMGVYKIEDQYIEKYIRNLLNDFGKISVREKTGKKIIKELTGNDVDIVLDPTLLLTREQWISLFNLKEKKEKPYLLAYMLGDNEQYWSVVYASAKQMNLEVKIIPVFKDDFDREGVIAESIGPYEFLQLFLNASYSCTDSFHGLIFSHIFRIPFTAFSRFKKGDSNNQNSRVYNLLELTGQMGRLYRNENFQDMIGQKVNFDYTEKIIGNMRDKSIKYLVDALKNDDVEEYETCVKEKNTLCCGCGGCVNVCPTNAIEVKLNENGFFEAIVNKDKCIQCKRCTSVCAFCTKKMTNEAKLADLYSFKCNDRNVLLKSTSGGAAYCISKYLIKKGYTIIACKYNQETHQAEHIIISNETQLSEVQGSKYLQSDFSNVMKKMIDVDTPIAVFGTPCQIASARRTFGTREDVVYIDLVCHGVPSLNLYAKYQEHIHRTSSVDTEKMKMYFRYKQNGWANIYLKADDGINEYCCSSNEDLFFRMFEVGNCYNETCYECRWRVDSESDIRLGDYWGPKYKEDSTGVNMVICFTEKGKTIAKCLKQYGIIYKQSIEDYLTYQQSLNLPKPVFYDELMDDLKNSKIKLRSIVEKYAIPLENKILSRTEHIKYVIKMMSRR
ncbi:MAG: polysaccharide pyruvyl transferase family protein [Lachnospiraceae bacterium]|nr:polysaccharide pyruvyl transferase family protein [Lachnospiraceae bacterium]